MNATVAAVVQKISNVIINPILAVIFAAGLLVFIWGIVEFISGLNADDHEKRESGKRHMVFGVLGMFIMSSAWAILKVIAGTVCNSALTNCAAIINH